MFLVTHFARRVPLFLASVSLWAASAVAQDRAPHNDAITAAKLRADLMFLGGDSFRGRLTNTPENNLALEWWRLASRRSASRAQGLADRTISRTI